MPRYLAKIVPIAACAMVLAICRVSMAVPVSVSNASYVYASVTGDGTSQTINLTAFPASNVVAADGDTVPTSVSITGNYSTSSFGFTTHFSDPDGEGTLASATTDFTANQALTFSASGSFNITGDPFFATATAALTDETAGSTTIFSDSPDAIAVTNPSLILPLETGALISGHQYELDISFNQFSGEPSGTGSYNFNIIGAAVPQPPAVWLGLCATLVCGGAALIRRRQAASV